MTNDIAVIGISGRFPMAKNIEEFWKNIKEGKECISEYTYEELLNGGIKEEYLKDENYIRRRGDIENIDQFDASFFKISPKEAEIIDPQHRLILECSWNTLDDAGYSSKNYKGRIGVFCGCSLGTYLFKNLIPNLEKIDSTGYLQAAIGNDKDSLSTKIAYHLDLKGPAITIQTSSSTSLVAISMACQSLLNYQCDMILSGGVSVGPPKKGGYMYSKDGIVSKDGHGRTFDADASGFVPGSGVGMVLLKRLEDAEQDKDHIYAVIKGFAVNNDGSSKVSYTAPSINAQAEVILEAQLMAGIKAEQINYIEAHGTGTNLGDPVELAALNKAFSSQTSSKGFCGIGSVKTNIGHLDATAGVAGFIKTVLSLYNKQIPPSLNFKKPNPKINFADSPFYVVDKLEEWNENEIRTSGVTSLGMGGTNAHVILQEYKVKKKATDDKTDEPYIYKFSAKTLDSLKRQVNEYHQFLSKKENISLKNISYTLSLGRDDFNYRKSFVALNKEELLKEILNEDVITNVQDYPNHVAFMFSGQGTQYSKMAYGLYQNYSVFRDILDFCAEKLTSLMGFDIREILFNNKFSEELLKDTNVSQPIIFSIQYAIAKLLLDFGLTPTQFIGHSLGEYTMATVLGVIDLNDALEIVVKRGELMQKAPKGKMLIVKSDSVLVQEYLKQYNVSLAAVNTKDFFTLSGTTESIYDLETYLAQQNVFCRIFPSSHAFHSHLLDGIKNEFKDFINGYKFKNVERQILSTSKGGFITSEEFVKPEYWANQLRNPVLFKDSLEELIKEGNYVLIEIGVDDTLSKLVKMIDSNITCLHCLENNSDDNFQLLNALAKLWLYGFNIDKLKLVKDQNWKRCSMPGYSFDPQKHWLSNEKSLEIERYDFSKRDSLLINDPKLETLEDVLKFTWDKLLGIDVKEENKTISFFESGGHSLMATQLISIIDKKLKITISLSEIYENETYEEMLQLINGKNKNNRSIIKSEKGLYYDLSCSQRLIWLDENLFKSSSYNLYQAFSIKGKFSVEKAKLAIKMLVDKNEMLRTNFLTIDNEPRMFINDVSEIEEEEYLLIENGVVDYEKILLTEIQKSLDLESDSLFKSIILQNKENEYIMCFVIHHIISDGWSIHVLVKEFINIYLNVIKNNSYDIALMEYSYMDYVENEKIEIMNLSQKSLNDYMNNFLLNKTRIEFKPKKELDLITGREGFSEKIKINKKTYEGLCLVAKLNKVTLFTVLLAQLKIALSKIYNQNTITIITGTAGREVQDFENIIGLFVKSFMVQTSIDIDDTDESIYQKVHGNFLKAYENYFSGIELFKKSEAANVIFQLDNISSVSGINKFKLGNLEIKDINIESKKVKTDLLVYAIEGKGLEVIFEFNSNIFDADSAKKIMSLYNNFLDKISESFFQLN